MGGMFQLFWGLGFRVYGFLVLTVAFKIGFHEVYTIVF